MAKSTDCSKGSSYSDPLESWLRRGQKLTVFDLFSGIGGMPLGLERTGGFALTGFCEVDPFRRSVLRKHWPTTPIHEDAYKLTPSDLCKPFWVTGGPPCHRTSVAAAIHGGRTGETLWPEMARLVKGVNPYGAVVEQPLTGGLDWEKQVRSDLEELGYRVSRWEISAGAIGAPHLRRRVFFIADRLGPRLEVPEKLGASELEDLKVRDAFRGVWDSGVPRAVRMDDGIPGGMVRRNRIKAIGSSTVPQVGELIGSLILRGMRTNSVSTLK